MSEMPVYLSGTFGILEKKKLPDISFKLSGNSWSYQVIPCVRVLLSYLLYENLHSVWCTMSCERINGNVSYNGLIDGLFQTLPGKTGGRWKKSEIFNRHAKIWTRLLPHNRNPSIRALFSFYSDLKVIYPTKDGSPASVCGERLIFPTEETQNIDLIKDCLLIKQFKAGDDVTAA